MGEARRAMLRFQKPVRNKQGVLGVHLDYVNEGDGTRIYKGIPAVPFKPCGLMVWGVDNHTLITSVVVSNEETLLSHDPIPAQFFATAKSYEELEEMAKEDKITLPTWCNFAACSPSSLVRVGVKGNIDNLCFWGIGVY